MNFRSTQKLGSGQFGTVNKGVWQSPAGSVEVAVKTLKEGASEQDRVKFLQEAAISGQFHHPNVIELHGVVTVGEPVSPKACRKSFVYTIHLLCPYIHADNDCPGVHVRRRP